MGNVKQSISVLFRLPRSVWAKWIREPCLLSLGCS